MSGFLASQAHQQQQRHLITRGYQFLEMCWHSPEAATRHVAVAAFAEALGDSDSLQTSAAMHVRPQV